MDYVERRRKAAVAGHRGDAATARALLDDADAGVRATALGALARAGALQAADLQRALADVDAGVRRRACEEAVGIEQVDLLPSLADADPSVVEAAAWALGERGPSAAGAVDELVSVARQHDDPLCRGVGRPTDRAPPGRRRSRRLRRPRRRRRLAYRPRGPRLAGAPGRRRSTRRVGLRRFGDGEGAARLLDGVIQQPRLRRSEPPGVEARLPRCWDYFFLQKRFSMSFEPLVTVTVFEVGPFLSPK